MAEKCLVVQSDRTIMVEVKSQAYSKIKDMLLSFAELIKTPDYFHTYQITNISLWNAASQGKDHNDIVSFLEQYSKYPIPANIQAEIFDTINRYGMIILEKDNLSGEIILRITSDDITEELFNLEQFRDYIQDTIDTNQFLINPNDRGAIKQYLIQIGYPVKDLAGYEIGDKLEIQLRDQLDNGEPFGLRDYQIEAVSNFYQDGSVKGGSGVLLLPCGAGKTIIGLGIMEILSQETLIICSSTVAVQQWKKELIDKTWIEPDMIGLYTADSKEICPITITTYQILSYRKDKDDDTFPHLDLFNSKNWGLIIYDEVHLLPAPVFRETAKLQTIRRLGLTATLVREDGYEEDVFSLIGPVKYNVPWQTLQEKGWIATANCTEIRVPLKEQYKSNYFKAKSRKKYRVAAENPYKLEILQDLVKQHKHESILVIGQYLDQLQTISKLFPDIPVITGSTSNSKRIDYYNEFEKGEVNMLIVSKVANYAIDIPNANVMIQLSGTFGSRQEEAQRLGRILRPKADNSEAYFYTIVTSNTVDQEYAQNRQLFLVEQGYRYDIEFVNGS